jgi:hypothetical protein
MFDFRQQEEETQEAGTPQTVPSQLCQWPVQLHLVSPHAPYYEGADVLLAADCVAYALGDFHQQYLKGKSLAIACPKLDEQQEAYAEKIRAWVEEANINTLTVMIMQVPCCMGLLKMAQQVVSEAGRKVPLKYAVVGVQGDIIEEDWA